MLFIFWHTSCMLYNIVSYRFYNDFFFNCKMNLKCEFETNRTVCVFFQNNFFFNLRNNPDSWYRVPVVNAIVVLTCTVFSSTQVSAGGVRTDVFRGPDDQPVCGTAVGVPRVDPRHTGDDVENELRVQRHVSGKVLRLYGLATCVLVQLVRRYVAHYRWPRVHISPPPPIVTTARCAWIERLYRKPYSVIEIRFQALVIC